MSIVVTSQPLVPEYYMYGEGNLIVQYNGVPDGLTYRLQLYYEVQKKKVDHPCAFSILQTSGASGTLSFSIKMNIISKNFNDERFVFRLCLGDTYNVCTNAVYVKSKRTTPTKRDRVDKKTLTSTFNLMKKLEWSNRSYHRTSDLFLVSMVCPVCGGTRDDGHHPSCILFDTLCTVTECMVSTRVRVR